MAATFSVLHQKANKQTTKQKQNKKTHRERVSSFQWANTFVKINPL